MNTATSDLQVLRNAMLFSLTTHRFSNRRSADRALVQTTGDKRKLNVTKALLVSPDLDKVNDLLNETYAWCFERAMQSSAVRRGIYFVKRNMVVEFEAKLAEANAKLNGENGLVAKFLATYETYKERMKLPAAPVSPVAGDQVTVAEGLVTFSGTVVRQDDKGLYLLDFPTDQAWPSRLTYAASEFVGGLGNLYKESDYPTVDVLREMFSLEHSWLALSVPDELPEEVRERETKKLRESFESAQEEIRYALRAGFKEMVAHAIERLTVKDGEKPKVFRETLVTNFRAFFDTFNARNLMEDSELESLVNQAKAVVNGLPRDASEAADALRSSPDIRATTVTQFAALNAQLDTLVIDKPIRRFDLDA